MSDFRDQLRHGLLDSYKYRIEKDCACAIYGKSNSHLAFNMLEASFNEGDKLPESFVPCLLQGGGSGAAILFALLVPQRVKNVSYQYLPKKLWSLGISFMQIQAMAYVSMFKWGFYFLLFSSGYLKMVALVARHKGAI